MKKIIGCFLCCLLLLSLVGCGGDKQASGRGNNGPADVNDVLEVQMAEADKDVDSDKEAEDKEPNAQTSSDDQEGKDNADSGNTDGIDLDLTVLSSTMVYSKVFDMMSYPEDYIGKTIKMKGPFAVYHDEDSDKYYFACIIQDATACCAQGIEFDLAGDYSYPEDYPEFGEEITVVGTFDTYKEGEYMYCTLRNATLF